MGRSVFPPPGAIRSMQWGVASGNVTVAAVNVNKSVLITTGAASVVNNAQNATLVKTSSTLLTYSQGSLTSSPSVAWQLIEYY